MIRVICFYSFIDLEPFSYVKTSVKYFIKHCIKLIIGKRRTKKLHINDLFLNLHFNIN